MTIELDIFDGTCLRMARAAIRFSLSFALMAWGLANLANADEIAAHSPIQGIAMPIEHAVVSSTIPGRLLRVLVSEGQKVQRGELIAVLDDRVAKAIVAAAKIQADSRAAIQQAQVSVRVASSYLERVEAAYHKGASSELEISNAAADRDQATAMLELEREKHSQAVEQYKLSLAELEQHQLRAPFAGQIVRVHAKPGRSLAALEPIITVSMMKQLEIELLLPISMFDRLDPGQSFRLNAGMPVNSEITAVLTTVSPLIDPATQQIRCRFNVNNSDNRFPAGFMVRFNEQHEVGVYPVSLNQ